MAVAHDAATELGLFTTSSPFTADHTPTGTPRGVLVGVKINGAVTDQITAVSYGGVACRRVGFASVTAGDEDARVEFWFLGSSVPTGTQTVSVTHTGTADTKWAVVATQTGASDLEVAAGGHQGAGISNPTLRFSTGPATQQAYTIMHTGGASPLTPPSGWSSLASEDFGGDSAMFNVLDTPVAGQVEVLQAAGSDDAAFLGVGIIEAGSGFRVKGGSATSGQVPVSANSFTVGLVGDLDGCDLFCFAVSRDHDSATAAATCTDDSGANTWTPITSDTDRKAYVWWKKATSADVGATVTVAGGVGSTTGGVVVVTGADTTPYNSLTLETNASGDESHAEITADAANSIIFFSVHDYANDTNTVTDVAGATIGSFDIWLSALSTFGSDCRVTIAAVTETGGPAATGAVTWTQTNATTKSVLFALSPASDAETHERTATASVTVSTSAAADKTVARSASSIVSVTVASAADKTVARTGSASVAVTVSAAADKTVSRTASATATVSVSATGVRVAERTATSSLTVTASADGQLEANRTATSGLTVTVAATGSTPTTHERSATAQVTVTVSAAGSGPSGDDQSGPLTVDVQAGVVVVSGQSGTRTANSQGGPLVTSGVNG